MLFLFIVGCCDCLAGLAARYQISKYPTIKLFRYGQPTKREYRGQRSVDSLSSFVEEQLKNSIIRVSNMNELNNIDVCFLKLADVILCVD